MQIKDGSFITDLDTLKEGTIYTLPSLTKVTNGCPEVVSKGLMATIITNSYNNGSKHQIVVSGKQIATREYYQGSWKGWII